MTCRPAGVPRTRNGKRNLDAPTPRTPWEKPDPSGIWHLEHSLCGQDGGCGDYVDGPEFRDMAERLPDGLSYQPRTAGLMKKRAAEVGRDDPVAESRPAGALRLLTSPPPRKIIESSR
jgi:hypothetical protein